MDPITTIAGPVNAAAFVDLSSTASGASTLAEVVQVITKTNEVIGGLTDVAADLVAAESDIADLVTDLATEASTRQSVDVALGAGLSTHTGQIAALTSSVDALELVTASGYVEVASGDLTLAADTAKTINFTGTVGMQNIVLPANMSSFSAGMNWIVVCNNADGMQVSPASGWAHSGLTSALGSLNLLVGDIAMVYAVDIGDTKGWSGVVIRGNGGNRSSASGAGDLGGTDEDDQIIWVDRTGDTGTRDYYLPNLTTDSDHWNERREITLVLYGTKTSGDFVVHTLGASDVFIDGSTSFTMTEKSTCRFIANEYANIWATIKGAA